MKRLISIAMILALVLTLAVGCSSPEATTAAPAGETTAAPAGETTAAPAAEGKIKIGIAANNYNDKWMTYVRDSMAARGEEYPDYEFISVDAKEDVATQISQVENLINNGIKGLILLPVSADMNPVVEACAAANIPIVTVSRKLANQGETTTHIGSDSIEAGQMQAEYVFEKIGGKGNVVILMGPPSNEAAVGRTDGVKMVQAEKDPDIKIVATEVGNWNRDEGMKITENWIQAGIEIDAILCNNDEMAIGAALALEQADARGDIVIAGVDATIDALQVMKAGDIDLTIFQDCFTDGSTAVDTIVDWVEGTPGPTDIMVPWQLVTPDKVDEFIKIWS